MVHPRTRMKMTPLDMLTMLKNVYAEHKLPLKCQVILTDIEAMMRRCGCRHAHESFPTDRKSWLGNRLLPRCGGQGKPKVRQIYVREIKELKLVQRFRVGRTVRQKSGRPTNRCAPLWAGTDIGYCKADRRLGRYFYKDLFGDSINVILAVATFNFKGVVRLLL